MEKRREPRTSVTWPLNTATMAGLGTGHTIDISLSGILFETDIELTKNDLAILQVKAGACTTIECVARVVRINDLAGVKTYGAEFCYISAADRQKLSFAILSLKDQSFSNAVKV